MKSMKSPPTVTCPSCRNEFELGEAMLTPLLEQARAESSKALQTKANELARQQAQLQQQQTDFAARLKDERIKIAHQESTKAQAQVSAALQEQLQHAKLEHELQLQNLRKQIAVLQQQVLQGSQQLQGRVQEVALERLLRTNFTNDQITAVPAGTAGADLVQKVMTQVGQIAGVIVWEAKRTKHWYEGWVTKLRSDQRVVKGDAAIIVSQVLPGGISDFGYYKGIWITRSEFALALAQVVRQSLLALAKSKVTQQNSVDKQRLIYDYITGSEYLHRITAIVEKVLALQHELAREQSEMQRRWARQGQQIHDIIAAASGMHGDLQGIIGGGLPELTNSEYPAIVYQQSAAPNNKNDSNKK